MKIWHTLALFGVDPKLADPTGLAVVFSIGVLLTIVQAFIAIFIKDRGVQGNYDSLSGFYFLVIYIPVMIFVSSLELLIIIQASANASCFAWTSGIVIVFLLIKAFSTEPDRHKFSLFGLTRWLQQQACNIIVIKEHRYPFQSSISPIWASHIINKKQKKYLQNVKN